MSMPAVRTASTRREEFFVAVISNSGRALCKEEGAVTSITGNEGRIAQARVNVRVGMRVFSENIWQSEGWTPRIEAVMEAVAEQVRITRHPLLIVCDANRCPEDFEKSLWFQRRQNNLQLADQKAPMAR